MTKRKSQINRFFVFTFIILVNICNLKNSFASDSGGWCNTNEHCQYGWYCIGGTADNGTTNLTGKCNPNILAKQLCTLHQSLNGIFGRFVVLFAIMVIGWSLLQGKFELKSIITLALGIILIFTPYAIISLITGDPRHGCGFEMARPSAGGIIPSS